MELVWTRFFGWGVFFRDEYGFGFYFWWRLDGLGFLGVGFFEVADLECCRYFLFVGGILVGRSLFKWVLSFVVRIFVCVMFTKKIYN